VVYLAKGLDDKGQTDIILLDFLEAFDKIPHKQLLPRVACFDIAGSVLAWV